MGKKVRNRVNIITISPFTFVAIVGVFLLGYGLELLSYVVVLMLHEFAHVLVSERLGYRMKKIKIMPYGIAIDGDFEFLLPKDEVKIAIAGPLINLFLWIVLVGVWWLFPSTYSATYVIANSSLFTAVINLIPIFPLDGGRVLHGILSLKLTQSNAYRVVRIVSAVFGVISVITCIILIILGMNFTYATICVFIISSIVLPNKNVGYERLYSVTNSSKRLSKGLRVRDLMVKQDSSILQLYKMLRPDYYTRFLLVNDDMQVVATITETELSDRIVDFDVYSTAISLAKPLLI